MSYIPRGIEKEVVEILRHVPSSRSALIPQVACYGFQGRSINRSASSDSCQGGRTTTDSDVRPPSLAALVFAVRRVSAPGISQFNAVWE
jgi:hypothetical protein